MFELSFAFIIVGLLVGFVVGVTGVGGGSLMTPILISFMGVPANVAIGTDLLYASISKFCGSLVHAKKMNIVWSIVIFLSIGSIPASILTTFSLDYFFHGSNDYKKLLTMVLGAMMVLTGASIVFRKQIEAWVAKFRKDSTHDVHSLEQQRLDLSKNRVKLVVMGAVLGVVVTLSSVGAGAFGVMALVLLFPHMPMIRIIGSDVVHAVLLTLVAGISHLFAGNVDYSLLGNLLIGAIPAIIVGTLLSSHLPEKIIRPILGLTILLLGVNFMVNPIKAKAKPVPQKVEVVYLEHTKVSTV